MEKTELIDLTEQEIMRFMRKVTQYKNKPRKIQATNLKDPEWAALKRSAQDLRDILVRFNRAPRA